MKVKFIKLNADELAEDFMADVRAGVEEKGGCGNPNCAVHGEENTERAKVTQKQLAADLETLEKPALIELVVKLVNNVHMMYYGFQFPQDQIVAAGLRDAFDTIMDKNPAFKFAMGSHDEEVNGKTN